MSIALMSIAWELDLPQTEKMVLLCLCDHANDAGICWPSMSRLARKCGVTDRTVQRTIKTLEAKGILTAEKSPGRTHTFKINPRHSVTPDTVSPPTLTTEPPTQCQGTPDTVSPEPSVTTKEPPSKNIARKPDDLDRQVWDDWRRVRKKPITPTVMKAVEREADKLGWTVAEAITHAAESSWQGFKAEWIKETNNGNDKRDGVAKALDRRIGLDPFGRQATGGSGGDCERTAPRLADLRQQDLRPDASNDAGGAPQAASGRR